MWCDGMNDPEAQNLSLGRKRSAQDDEETENKEKKKKDDESKEEKVEETIQTLQDKHGKEFTPMQYRIGAEMHVGAISQVSMKHLPIQCFSELVELLQREGQLQMYLKLSTN